LNALSSDQLVAFVERKLRERGVKKIVPDQQMPADSPAAMKPSRFGGSCKN
jgi:hypothetical protein